MDQIKIRGLEIFANHGVFPEENVLGQKFVVSAVLYTDTRQAGRTDQLEHSVNYGAVSQFIKNFVTGHTWKLLETVANRLAEAILLEYPLVQQVELEIQKPWAPVGLPLDTVSVSICRGWHRAYIALGSNMGDKKGYLDFAVESLGKRHDCRVKRVSSYLVTAPYGGVEQDDFLNGALELETLLEPRELLDALHEIEQGANRVREIHWGPRTLDLDILLYDDLVLDEPDLQIPHVEMHKRDFVLTPLAEIAPWVRHPLTKKTVAEMHQAACRGGKIRE
ncbi:MAG: 2-amino-4-hydroxy-6-hydroxymethyldihydropteridine diphosphokinase [Faecousia sp.]